MSSADANLGLPVRFTGVLTFYLPGSQLCFVQDETAGIYVLPSSWPAELDRGDVVEVEGISGSGRFSPIIQAATLRPKGERRTVRPRNVSIEELNSGRWDAQWVRLEGVIQSCKTGDGVWSAQLWSGECSVSLLVFANNVETNVVDAIVSIEGVAGTFYNQDRLSGFGVFLPAAENIRILSPPQVAFASPVRKVRGLNWYSRDGGMDRRVHLQGVVTVVWPGQAFFVQDDTGAVRCTFPKDSIKLQPGDILEVAGFVRNYSSVPKLEETLLQKKGTTKVSEAPLIPVRELFTRPASGQYLSIEGVVSRRGTLESGTTFIEVENGNGAATALLKDEALSAIRAGSRVRVAGAWSSAPPELRNEFGPVLWLNSKSAVTVLALPLPVSTNSSDQHAGALIAATLGALALVVFVLFRSRRTEVRFAAHEQSGGLRMAELEREVKRLNESRERLGRDLHDRIIQSIYAVGLNIDHCAQSIRSEADVEGRLKSVLREINGVIGELRNVILGLETTAIQPREFRTALKSLALALGSQESNRIRLDIQEEALAALSPGQATELVYIAREALSNSLRHGEAQTTTFSLDLRDEKIRFAIEDDGRGFSVAQAQGKGFGLRNMAKRAEALGAVFRINSEEGHGTRVLLDIPRQKPHFSTK